MQVEGEDPTWLEQAITSTVDSLKGEGVGTKGMDRCSFTH